MLKAYLTAFRSLPCIRKQVNTCLLQIEPTWLMIKFRCHHDLIRTYRLPVIETETLQALYTVDEVPNHLVIGADVFSTAVKNFQLSERDITLAVEERTAVLRNYVPGGSDPGGVIRSELKLDSGEFISFTVRQQTSITFCLKAFRAVLYFSEPSNLPLGIKFSTPGNPVVIISDSPTFELRFVLSSLAPEDCDTTRSDSQQLLTPLRSLEDREQQMQLKKTTHSKQASTLDEAWEGSGTKSATSSKANNRTSNSKSSLDSSIRPIQNDSLLKQQPRRLITTSQQSTSSTTSSVRAVVGTSTASSRQNQTITAFESFRPEDDADQNEVEIPASDNEAEEEEEELVPASPPPPKRARLLFQRCYEPTLHTEDFEGGVVYAPDSDEEN